MKKRDYSTMILILVFLVGLSLLLYPTVSNYWNSLHQSRSIVDYEAVMEAMAPEDYTAWFQEAEEYNRQLLDITFPLMNYDQMEGYDRVLNVDGSGIIGYITIPKIQVELPIYRGTSESVLRVAVGHIPGTSFPIGGESTHAVLSAHRGLPSARLFTDLDELTEGDIFTVTVLDRTLTYRVDQICTVLPQDVEELSIEEGEDYCTLVTCTPYGVNTHRLLVRGCRQEDAQQAQTMHVTADGEILEPAVVVPVAATPLLLMLLLMLLVKYPRRKKSKGETP